MFSDNISRNIHTFVRVQTYRYALRLNIQSQVNSAHFSVHCTLKYTGATFTYIPNWLMNIINHGSVKESKYFSLYRRTYRVDAPYPPLTGNFCSHDALIWPLPHNFLLLSLSVCFPPSHSFLWFSSPNPPAEHTSPVLLPSPLHLPIFFFPSIFFFILKSVFELPFLLQFLASLPQKQVPSLILRSLS